MNYEELEEEEIYQALMEIEEWIGHENVSLDEEEKEELEVTLTYLIFHFEEVEEYLKCRDLKNISDIISNIACVS